MFSIDRYFANLTTKKLGRKFEYLNETSSTNTFLIENDREYGATVVAEKQTAGKGRTGRSWFTFEDTLMFSIKLQTHDSSKLLPLNMIAGYSVIDVLRRYAKVDLKWPNDCVINGAKLVGILLDVKFNGNKVENVVLGVGINLNCKEIPISLKNIATTLSLHTEKTIFKDIMLAEILNELELKIDAFENGKLNIKKEWHRYSANLNKEISVHKNGTKVTALEVGITELGELMAKNSNGEIETISFGDITCC